MEKLKQNPIVKKIGLNRILLVCILIVMFAVFKVVLGINSLLETALSPH
mgnify:CR=1 FL=1